MVAIGVLTILSVTSVRAEIVLYGAVSNGDSYLLSLSIDSAPSHWIPVGGEIAGYAVLGYDEETCRAKLKKGDMLIESAFPSSRSKGLPPPQPMPKAILQVQKRAQAKAGDIAGSQLRNLVAFSSSNGEVTDSCVAVLSAAQESICIQAMKYMPAMIDRALVAAGKRGVKVQAFLDEPQPLEARSGARAVPHGNVPIVIVVDGATVITGLLSASQSIQDQQMEGLLVIRDKELAKLYLGELTRKTAAPKRPAGQ